jgi:hypothetical protein
MYTRVQLDRMPAALNVASGKLVRKLDDGSVIVDLPRYFDFRLAASELARQGVNFVDIAGNRSVILVTAWIAMDKTDLPGRLLFEQSLLTIPGKKRVAIVLPVGGLTAFLADAGRQGIQVEHVYDY